MARTGYITSVSTSQALFTADRSISKTPSSTTAGTYTLGGIADGPPARGVEITVTGGSAAVYLHGLNDRTEAFTGSLPAGTPADYRVVEPEIMLAGSTIQRFSGLASGAPIHRVVIAPGEGETINVQWSVIL
ncbi:MAG: hypothetical protein SFY96_10340 [Planctomycetota bacterium]|nr:hypothetical protein [Planctomycetota bacterium]